MDKAPDAYRTISEVAEDLDLPQHVLRFWETRFPQIKPLKRGGGRRYYRPDDVELLNGIRHLLYKEGYTIKGVQRILREQGFRAVINAAREPGLDWQGDEAVLSAIPAPPATRPPMHSAAPVPVQPSSPPPGRAPLPGSEFDDAPPWDEDDDPVEAFDTPKPRQESRQEPRQETRLEPRFDPGAEPRVNAQPATIAAPDRMEHPAAIPATISERVPPATRVREIEANPHVSMFRGGLARGTNGNGGATPGSSSVLPASTLPAPALPALAPRPSFTPATGAPETDPAGEPASGPIMSAPVIPAPVISAPVIPAPLPLALPPLHAPTSETQRDAMREALDELKFCRAALAQFLAQARAR